MPGHRRPTLAFSSHLDPKLPPHRESLRASPGALQLGEQLLARVLAVPLDVSLEGRPGPQVSKEMLEAPARIHLEPRSLELLEWQMDAPVAFFDQSALLFPVASEHVP